MNQILKSILVTFLACFVSFCSQAQHYFDYNENIREAYEKIISLKFDEAKVLLNQMAQDEPHNLARLHIENYIDFFTIFINEDESEYKRLRKKQKARIKAIDNADVKSPYTLFSIAEINLQWAIARSKFGEQLPILRDIYGAYRALRDNQNRYPNFQENKKSLSVIHAVNETLPIPRFLKRLFSLEGSIEKGEREIKEMLAYAEETKSMFYPEALASYAVITLYQRNDKDKAFEIIQNSKLDPKSSPLVGFLFAKIAQRAGYNDAAISYLESCPSGPEYKSFEYIDYLKGLSYIRKLDVRAKPHLEAFVQNFKGRLYIKEAYQKLAWSELVIHDNFLGYLEYITKVKQVGTEIVDDDQQAQKEAESGISPNPEILKARLLYDGGYYQKSYDTLIKKTDIADYSNLLNLEYYYRLGRVTQALHKYPDAIQYFSRTIERGIKSKEYYACNAALQMGVIYEEQEDIKNAKKYFNLCLDMDPDKYKTSLHQKAKAGLDRINNL